MKKHFLPLGSGLLLATLLGAAGCQTHPRPADGNAGNATPSRSGQAASAGSMTRPAISHIATRAFYNVRDYGAAGDGVKLDSPAINRAIDAAVAAGGGTVLLPPGTYLSASIHLQSNINLQIDAGAVLLGAPQTPENNPYDPVEKWEGHAYQDGGHTYFHNSLIWGENLVNVSITGRGMINGGGLINQDGTEDQLTGFAAAAGTINRPPTTPNGPATQGAAPATRPAFRGFNAPNPGNKAIALKLCNNVLIRDVTIYHGGHFAILATGVDLLTIDNVTIDTNRDGMDIDCCRNVMVSNCRVNSPTDDGICPKSTLALGELRITENMTITNCEVSGFQEGTLLDGTMKPYRNRDGSIGGTGRIKMGTESNGGFRNVTISNCTFRSCRGLALEEVDGGILENFAISNLTMMDIQGYPIYITTGQRNRGPNVAAPSVMRNITISHVIATGVDATSGIQITGLPHMPIENLRIDDVRIHYKGGGTKEQADRVPPELDKGYPEPSRTGVMPAYGLYARHVKDLELANLRFTFEQPDARPAIAAVDVHGLEIDNLKAQLGEGVTAARFEGVTGVVIRNSPLLSANGAINQSDTIRPAGSVQSNFTGVPNTRNPQPTDQQ